LAGQGSKMDDDADDDHAFPPYREDSANPRNRHFAEFMGDTPAFFWDAESGCLRRVSCSDHRGACNSRPPVLSVSIGIDISTSRYYRSFH